MLNNTAQDTMVSLHLPLSQVNIIISGLAELPYKISAEVLHAVQGQASAEVNRQQRFMVNPNLQDEATTVPPSDK